MLPDNLRNRHLPKSKKPSTPLWKGPQVDGVTQSLLGRFLVCRERFRLLVVEGLKPSGGWNHRTGYGDMWHICEEAAASEVRHFDGELSGVDSLLWSEQLEDYATELVKRYPLDRDKIEHWYMVCKVQFPEYIRYWMEHPDNMSRTPLIQEGEFNVPYQLHSGRTVHLRGKWDSVDLIKEGKTSGVWLQENKTKGDVNPAALQQQLRFDLQTMFYLVALDSWGKSKASNGLPYLQTPIKGVRYNVVRRPLSGGKGSIVRHKATKNKPQESVTSFYGRVAQVIKDNPENFFFRWKSEVTAKDIETFKVQCLNPVLEQLCEWWDWIKDSNDPEICTKKYLGDPWAGNCDVGNGGLHFRFPYGVYNPLTEGITGDLDSYLDTGSTTGLVRTDNLFPELHGKEQSK